MDSVPFSEDKVPLEKLKALENKIDLEDAKKALRDIAKHGTISWEDVKLGLGL